MAVGAALVVGALSWSVVGAAGTAVLAGGWLLACAVGRLVPALSGPPAWAVGVLGEVALVVGLSTVLGTVGMGRYPALVQSAVLAVPVAIGVVLVAVSWRSSGRRRPGAVPLPSRWPVALLVTAGGLAGFAVLGLLGRYFDVAWAMGGDARNHARMARELLGDGGMTLEFLRSAPAGANAFTAILAGAGGRDVAAGHLLLDDANALADTYVLAAIAVAAMLAAAVLESLPRAARAARLTLPTAGVALIAGAGAVTPLLLGTTLADGFMSAYVVIALVLATLVLGLRAMAEPRALPIAVPVLVVATGLTLATWPVIVVLPMALLVLVAVLPAAPADGPGPGPRLVLAVRVLAGVSVVGFAGVLVLSWASLRNAFGLSGAITPPASWLLPALLLMAAAVALAPWAHVTTPGPDDESASRRRVLAVPVVVGAVGAVTVVALRVLADGPGLGWSYYAFKTSWLVACCLVWVPLVPLAAAAARWTTPDSGAVARRLTAVRAAGVAAAAAAVVLALGNATAAPEPLVAAARGWGSPSAQAVGDAVEAADRGGPFVFWGWSDFGNDRLANFWAALAWSTDDDGLWVSNPAAERSFALWAYFADGTTTSTLCELVVAEPDIIVYTRDDDLGLDLEASCPDADPDIVVGD